MSNRLSTHSVLTFDGASCDWAAGELDPTENYFTIGGYIARPASRGSIHISSASPPAPPDYDARIMWEEVALESFIWLYKVQRNVARSHPHFRGEPENLHPPFAADSPSRLLNRAEV
jgi:alcohol oxidase